MTRLFAVTLAHGAQWDTAQSLEGQEEWPEHAAFMDALVAEGVVALGGPLEGTPDVLLIIRAQDADEIRKRLAPDPWHRNDLLRFSQVAPWTLRLGSLG
jgi:uncharacterized protein YciI